MSEEHTKEEIVENIDKRIDLALELLEKHPNVVETWDGRIANEFSAAFTTVDPDCTELEIVLGLDEYGGRLKNHEEHGLVFDIEFDADAEYTYVTRDGEEVPFTEWSESFEWSLAEYEVPIEEVVRDAGYTKE